MAALPILAMVGGTALQALGNSQAQHATTSAISGERKRQQAFTAEQQSRFDDSLNTTKQLTDPNAQKSAIDSRDAVLQANIAPATATNYLPGSSSAPAVVKGAQDKSDASTAAYASGIANAMARMGAPGDQLQRINIANNRDTQQIGQIGTSKRVSADILPTELQAAAAKGGTLRALGGLAMSIGQMMAMGGFGSGGGIGGMLSGGNSAALNPVLPSTSGISFGGLPTPAVSASF